VKEAVALAGQWTGDTGVVALHVQVNQEGICAAGTA
jgi:hypothetical protein